MFCRMLIFVQFEFICQTSPNVTKKLGEKLSCNFFFLGGGCTYSFLPRDSGFGKLLEVPDRCCQFLVLSRWMLFILKQWSNSRCAPGRRRGDLRLLGLGLAASRGGVVRPTPDVNCTQLDT